MYVHTPTYVVILHSLLKGGKKKRMAFGCSRDFFCQQQNFREIGNNKKTKKKKNGPEVKKCFLGKSYTTKVIVFLVN